MARLFHSLVVCGAGLTLLQCGGRYSKQGDGGEDDDADGSGAASSHAGTSSAQGGSRQPGDPGSAGALVLGGAPGSSAFGGTAVGGSGPIGMPTAGASTMNPGTPKPPGPTAQWVCDGVGASCYDGAVDLTNVSCKLDLNRPFGPGDCQSTGRVFACIDGIAFGEVVSFNCECLPPAADGTCVCPMFNGGCDARIYIPQACHPVVSNCGCAAVTCITK